MQVYKISIFIGLLGLTSQVQATTPVHLYTVAGWQKHFCLGQPSSPKDIRPSLFCKALAKTKLAKQIDEDSLLPASKVYMGEKYLLFMPNNEAIRKYLKKNSLNEQNWLNNYGIENFVKRHIAKGPGFMANARTYPSEFNIPTLAGTTINWKFPSKDSPRELVNGLNTHGLGFVSFYTGMGFIIDQVL